MMRQLLLLLSFFLLIACTHTSEETTSIRSTDKSQYLGNFSIVEDEEMIEEVMVSDIAISSPRETQNISQKIIKTGNLRFETQELAKTHQRILAAVKQAGGYIQSDNTGKNYNTHYHNLTVRIPAAQFDRVLASISEGIAYFDEKTISQRDVTEEFVDIEARLKAKRALENRYLALLEKARNVKEMLEIERELSKIREEIESREGRLKYLKNQVSESTLHLHFYKTTTNTGVTVSYGQKIANAFKNGYNAISQFFLTLLSSWPFLILVGALVFFVRRWIKNRKKK